MASFRRPSPPQQRGRGDGGEGEITPRRGFTVTEVVVATAVLAGITVVLAQVATWSLVERVRGAERQEVVESAANVLESARAQSWEQLTPTWAKGQRLPESLQQRLLNGRLVTRLEPDASTPQIKRLTVTIAWDLAEGLPVRPVQLATLFGDRSTTTPGGKP